MDINVDKLIEQSPLGILHYWVLLASAGAIVLDGFDIQLLAFTAPRIMDEWGLTKANLGPLLAAALIGMAVGTLIGGVAGDRWGRKPTLIVSALVFGLLTIAASFAQSPNELMVLRFLAGIGIGGAVPTSTALIAEWAPARFRSIAVTLVLIGLPIGGFIGAAIAGWVIPLHGWRACFVVGGVLPLLLAAFILLIPESPKFLAARPNRSPRLAVILNSLTGTSNYSENDRFTFSEAKRAQSMDLRLLLEKDYRRATAGLWLSFFANLFSTYCLINWIPTILSSHGFPLTRALQGSFYFNLFGIAGALVGAVGITRIGSRRTLLLTTLTGLFGVVLTALQLSINTSASDSAALAVILGLAVIGGALISLQIGLYSVSSNAYPTDIRATGIGTASSMGRLGAISSAFLAGALLSASSGDFSFFLLVAVMLVMVGASTMLIDRHIDPKDPA